ncbi:MAG: hypothetical protein ACREOI_13360, partial [bacterium]
MVAIQPAVQIEAAADHCSAAIFIRGFFAPDRAVGFFLVAPLPRSTGTPGETDGADFSFFGNLIEVRFVIA